MVIMYEVVNRASNHLFSESILFLEIKFYVFYYCSMTSGMHIR